MIQSTIGGKKYVLVQHLQPEDRYRCEGCCFDNGMEDCEEMRNRASVKCEGNLIYIEDNPEAIADYMARRLT